ncbi:MAG: hypothetical protein U1E04_13190 [Hylemonella sp.]|nr:hypothetical protein [Hylemonella sp.]
MANITSDQLRDYKESITSGDSDAIARMYSDLYDQGYNYAGWAEGVAKGNSFTGSAAIDFLKESYSSGACEKLSDDQINKIRRDMAQRTLDEYIRISDANGGTLNRDLRYEETKSIHDDVFRQNGLSLENWTLDLPMELIRQKYGDQTVEKLWQQQPSRANHRYERPSHDQKVLCQYSLCNRSFRVCRWGSVAIAGYQACRLEWHGTR